MVEPVRVSDPSGAVAGSAAAGARLPEWARKGSPLAREARALRARRLGFPAVHAGVFVRSSFGAAEVFEAL